MFTCSNQWISEAGIYSYEPNFQTHTEPVLSSIALVYISVTWEGGEGEGKKKNSVCVCVSVKVSQKAVKCDVTCVIEGETSFILAFKALHFYQETLLSLTELTRTRPIVCVCVCVCVCWVECTTEKFLQLLCLSIIMQPFCRSVTVVAVLVSLKVTLYSKLSYFTVD